MSVILLNDSIDWFLKLEAMWIIINISYSDEKTIDYLFDNFKSFVTYYNSVLDNIDDLWMA